MSDRQHLSKYVRVSSSRIRLGETRQQFRLFCRHELTKSLIPSAAQSGIQISQIQVGPQKEATTKLSIKNRAIKPRQRGTVSQLQGPKRAYPPFVKQSMPL